MATSSQATTRRYDPPGAAANSRTPAQVPNSEAGSKTVARAIVASPPPFELLLYVMLGVAPPGTTLFQVANAAFPFLICDTILILILVAFPALALWLPSLM